MDTTRHRYSDTTNPKMVGYTNTSHKMCPFIKLILKTHQNRHLIRS